jgi:diguanylate cyclase
MGACVENQDHEQALAKTALAVMNECGVAPAPENFELFYNYASGRHQELSRAIGEMMSRHDVFTPQVLDDLRARFVSRERHAKAMDDVGSGISEMLDMVMARIEVAGKDASDYGRTLSAATGTLSTDHTPDALRKMVDGLVGATRAMEARTKTLETELQQSSEQVSELKTQLDDVRKESRLDPLTNIANRKAFDIELEAAIADATDGGSVSLLMCDIDHFKKFNDCWGHQTGDQVLRLVAGCLSENVKGRDTAARYGGEEFAVILRQTALRDAVNLANQIRSTVTGKKLVKKSTGDILGKITISIGAAQLRPNDKPETLLKRADMCLYHAKNTGRNRVVGESELSAPADIDAA